PALLCCALPRTPQSTIFPYTTLFRSNAYVDEPRATQDVDIISTRARELAEELREHLAERFRIAVRTREIKDKGFRIYQVRSEGKDRKSTRLNSSHVKISYAVFCLKKK